MSAALRMEPLENFDDALLPWESIGITRFSHYRKPQGRREALSWFDLCREFMHPVVASEKFKAPLWSPATFKGDYREKDSVEQVSCLGLDFDELPPADPSDRLQGLGRVYEAFSSVQALITTTYRHTAKAPRCRVLIPLSRAVSVAEYEALTPAAATICKHFALPPDPACKDASRAWFVPAVARHDSPFRALTTNADDPLDVDRALANVRRQERPKVLPRAVAFTGDEASRVERCRKYVAKMGGAISGAAGHTQTFKVALAIVQKFELDGAAAWSIFAEYNARCQPPWSDKELKHKLDQARKAK